MREKKEERKRIWTSDVFPVLLVIEPQLLKEAQSAYEKGCIKFSNTSACAALGGTQRRERQTDREREERDCSANSLLSQDWHMSGIGGLPRDAILVTAYLARSCRLQEVRGEKSSSGEQRREEGEKRREEKRRGEERREEKRRAEKRREEERRGEREEKRREEERRRGEERREEKRREEKRREEKSSEKNT